MPPKLRHALLSGMVVALAGALLARTQARPQDQPAQNQPAAPTFRTEANYVRVDVYPTRDGVPVADLTQADFEVLDNGTPQKVEQFERVVIRGAGPQEARIEPQTVRESRSMLENPRSRVFVLFLDTYHVDVAGSATIRQPLVDALDRVIGVDDLVAVMTPEMPAGDIAFVRKTTSIASMLAKHWYWGERGRLNPPEPEDRRYEECYPAPDQRPIVAEMIARRHEKRTLDAIEDLVIFLHGVREERKAVLAISSGWLLYRPNQVLAAAPDDRVPVGTRIGVDPNGGRLTTDAPRPGDGYADCDVERIHLAELDDLQQFHLLLDEANRSNTSFYPVDPRGLAVFDTDIGPDRPPPIDADARMLQTRLSSLRTLADRTDGLAIVNTNNISAGLRRVVDDLTSYYLLGYYASGRLDGRFHSITVRVKRPGIRVRARQGYLAASEAEAVAVRRPAGPRPAGAAVPTPAAAAEARALAAVLSPLEGYTRPLPVRLQAAAGWKPDGSAAVWAIVETGAGPEWRGGADADLSLTDGSGTPLASARAHLDPGTRAARTALAARQPLPPGEYFVRVRVRTADGSESANDTLRVTLSSAPSATGGIFVRRGAASANREVATGDLRFRRGEQLRIDVPTPTDAPFTARLLDRTGKPLAVPVTARVRDDSDGTRWRTAQLALAPLAPADYVVEIAAGESDRMLFGFRVLP